jgi:CRP-like cAMP-binding protein
VKELAQIEKVMLLRRVDLFAHCHAEEVVRIAAISGERRFSPGERIYATDDPADALYCVVEGKIDLNGADGLIRTVGRDETFGVTEILSGRLRSCDATAAGAAVTLAISADDFFDLLSHNIEIVKALFREILAEEGRNV